MSTLREIHLPAQDIYWPRGTEALLEYNGLTFNDRRESDKIIITKINGFDDPDVRDSREVNPDRDGETAFDSLYGGRTITLTGYAQAGNLASFRKLWHDFKLAFNNLEDLPLYSRWLDWKDTFIDSKAMGDYTYITGSGTLNPSSTGLAPTSTAAKEIYLSADKHVYNDVNLILPYTHNTSVEAGWIFRFIDANNYLKVVSSSTALTLIKVVAGVTTTLDSVAHTPVAGTTYYLQVVTSGLAITYRIWSSYPDDVTTANILATDTATLAGGDATLFPSTKNTRIGLRWVPNSTSDRISLLDAASISPGDHYITCRKVGKIESEDSFTSRLFRRDFLLTLRASDPSFVSRKISSTTALGISGVLTFPAGGAGFTFPASGSGIVFGTTLTTITNLGRSSSYPIIKFSPISSVTDDFSTNTISNYTVVSGGTFSISGGQLVPSVTTPSLIIHTASTPMSGSWVTMKVITGASVASGFVAVIAKYLDTNNHIRSNLTFGGAASGMQIAKVDGGIGTNLATTSATLTTLPSTSYWLRLKVEGNDLTFELWTSVPTLTGIPTNTITTTLSTADASKFGYGIAGYHGIQSNPAGTDYRYDDFQATPTGATSNKVVFNTTNGTKIGIDGEIPADETWEFNTKDRTLIETGSGDSKFEKISVDTNWLSLAGGPNTLLMGADNSNTFVTIIYRHASL